MKKLNQVIALEKTLKGTVNQAIDVIHKVLQKGVLFDGFTKVYKKGSEEGEDAPPQAQHIQFVAAKCLQDIAGEWTKLFDVTAQKDFANCTAKADVEVDGVVVLKDAPVTYLLFLEKQLTDLHTIIQKAPVLDASERWDLDPNTGVYRTQPVLTQRTKKVQKAIVLYPHSAEHPAQTQLITEDVVVGNWEQTRFSGALPATRVKVLLNRVNRLREAVKVAREEANMAQAPDQEVGKKIFDWVLAE